MSLFAIPLLVALVLWVVLLVAKAVALVDALRYSTPSFPAAGKQSKTLWLIFLGLGLAFHVVTYPDPTSLLSLAGDVAAIVYLVDVRPALRAVNGRSNGRGNGRNEGPYGPW
ncbi:MAG: DUF2516 family protein [Actinomycetales bacterium]